MKDASQVQEPCIQGKKRLEGPASCLSTSDFDKRKTKDDYILLGKNDKFHHNVQYKVRTTKWLDTKDDQNERSQPTRQEDDYMLLGNNDKFVKNVVYKPKPIPQLIMVNGKDNSQMTDQPLSTLSNFDDDYMLLGNHAKFSNNVVYKPKMRQEFNPSQGNGKENEPADDPEHSQVQVKKLEPAPFVDISKFREAPKKSKKSGEKDDYSELKIKKKVPQMKISHRSKIAKRRASNNPEVSEEKTVRFQSPLAAPRSPKENGNDKRFISSLYKAGIHLPSRPLMEQSEYQKNFTWKSPEPNSSGKENKRNFETSSINMTYMPSRGSIPRTTEYMRNFPPWEPLYLESPSPPAIVEKKIVRTEPIVPKKTKRPALKPPEPGSPLLKGNQVKNTSPDQGLEIQTDRGPGVCSDEVADKIQQEDMKNFKSPSDPPTKPPKFMWPNSEYRANYRPPSKYDYMNNVWDTASFRNKITVPKDNKCNWYSEVCDLRRKAVEYRRRTNNSHFCANDMGHLLSNQMKLWERTKSDEPTTPEVNLKSMRPAGIVCNKHFLLNPGVSQRISPYHFVPEPQIILEDVDDDDDDDDDYDYDDDDDDDDDNDDDSVVSVHSEEKQEPAINHGPPSSETNVVPPSSETNVAPLPSIEEDAEGSAPAEKELSTEQIRTPELLQQYVKRHHLDRTTPTEGGLLLSPVIARKKILTDHANSPIVSVPADDIKSSNHSPAPDVEEKPKHCVKTCALPSKSNSQQTFGKPSKKTYLLSSDELLSCLKPLSKSSSEQPAQIMSQDRSNITLRSGGNIRPKKSNTELHPAGLIDPGVPEHMLSSNKVPEHMLNKVLPVRLDANENNSSDFLSQSLESNSSLASEILERTRKRLDFW